MSPSHANDRTAQTRPGKRHKPIGTSIWRHNKTTNGSAGACTCSQSWTVNVYLVIVETMQVWL